LEFALRAIQGEEVIEKLHPAQSVLQAILKNELPEGWYDLGTLPIANSETLIKFLKMLSLKYENLSVLIKDRDCLMFPVIPLPKLFDPFFLFVSMIWNHSQLYHIPFNECEFILQRVKAKPLTKQNNVGGIYLSGFKITGGHVNDTLTYLEDEFSREFSTNMGSFLMRVRRRNKMTYLSDEDPSIPVMIRPKRAEDLGSNADIVNEYHEYMNKYMLNKVPKKAKDVEESYPVRIPFIDPCSRLFKNYFNLELFLYLKSNKPQEYWQMKGTCVLLQIDA